MPHVQQGTEKSWGWLRKHEILENNNLQILFSLPKDAFKFVQLRLFRLDAGFLNNDS